MLSFAIIRTFGNYWQICMRLPSCDHDKNAWKSSFIHLVEVQDHLVSRCREPGASPTTGRDETDEQAAEYSNGGSTFLGSAFPKLEPLAEISRHCQAGYRCPLAPQGFQAHLEIQIQKTGKAESQSWDQRPGEENGCSQSDLGCTQDSWGIAQARFRGFRKNRIEPDAPASAEFKAVSDLADFPKKSCG